MMHQSSSKGSTGRTLMGTLTDLKSAVFTTRPPKVEPHRAPLPFTLAAVRASIPEHLQRPVIATSWRYIAQDLAQFVLAALMMYFVLIPLTAAGSWSRVAAWLLYGFAQGCTGFGLWVIGHECGHQAYFGVSRRSTNDTVGYMIHSLMLTPYFSWKYTHATHHKFTNHATMDTVYVPVATQGLWWEIGEVFPPIHSVLMLFYFFVGWPGYVLFNLEGKRFSGAEAPTSGPLAASHFWPFAPYFSARQRSTIWLSDVGVAVMAAVLVAAAWQSSWQHVALWYGLPWLGTFAWLVVVTLLQHADPRVPHFGEEDSWDFLKGALCTVDRTYGWPIDSWLHHITDAHVVHHLFPTSVPFYHAQEATRYCRTVLGEHYLTDDRFLLVQLWQGWWAHHSMFLHAKQILGNGGKATTTASAAADGGADVEGDDSGSIESYPPQPPKWVSSASSKGPAAAWRAR